MKRKKKIAGMLLASTLVLGVPLSSMATAKAPAKVEYVALGDSLAAGQTPNGFIDYSYPDYVVDTFKSNSKSYKLADYDNFAIPGYTTVKLKNDVLNSSKIRAEIKGATHITIDIGANDLLSILKTNPDPANAAAAIGEVGANLQSILSTIDKLNKKAKVYVMGYYNPYPYLPAEQQAQLLPLLTGLNTQIEAVASKNGDKYVPTEALINKDYQKYMKNPQDIHLNTAGYKAIAKEFWKAITKK